MELFFSSGQSKLFRKNIEGKKSLSRVDGERAGRRAKGDELLLKSIPPFNGFFKQGPCKLKRRPTSLKVL